MGIFIDQILNHSRDLSAGPTHGPHVPVVRVVMTRIDAVQYIWADLVHHVMMVSSFIRQSGLAVVIPHSSAPLVTNAMLLCSPYVTTTEPAPGSLKLLVALRFTCVCERQASAAANCPSCMSYLDPLRSQLSCHNFDRQICRPAKPSSCWRQPDYCLRVKAVLL